ncbi:hypothetical protein [Candidatus Magnetaquicoccus inordinatus]|uniref:hypothetical protein n=1 Tax=Candidatus Magnetaquicoccus inordinatus TaxID=2496818 RepID=UPI00102AC05C|nr:hypothetical protein [Candidatus Magnetaquicoccus inordinatus]
MSEFNFTQEVLLSMERIEAKLEEVSKNQQEMREDSKRLETRLRKVEQKTNLIGAIGGTGAAAVVALSMDYIKKTLGL